MASVLERINDILSSIGEDVIEAVHGWTWWDILIIAWYGLMLCLILTHLQNTP